MRGVLVFALLVSACSPHKVTKDPLPPLSLPASYASGGKGSAPLPDKCWTDFGDGRLSELIELALRDSFQLRAAWARIDQARSLVIQANSGKYPQVDVSASVASQKLPPDRVFPGGDSISNQFTLSLGAAYEVDLWRRMANQGQSAALNALAARDDMEAIAMSLAAEVTEAWFDLVAQNAQKKLLQDQLKLNETYLQLVELRFENGLVSALDVYQQRQQLVATRSRLTLIDSAIKLLEYRLAVLVGKTPGTLALSAPDTVPPLPPVPGTGIPANLLTRRPDVRAIRRRVEAADYQVAIAIADRLPSLRLSGSTSLQSTSVSDLIRTPIWSLIASVAAPIFDAGRRRAEVARTRAVVRELLMSYAQVLLLAMAEVESALAQETQQLVYITDLEETVELAASSLREAQARYSQGLIDYFPVLTALQVQQQAELSLLLARRQLLSHRVQLCRALGGTWTQALTQQEDTPQEDGKTQEDTQTQTDTQRKGSSSL